MKTLACLLLLGSSLMAQSGTTINRPSTAPPPNPVYHTVWFNDGSNLTYGCKGPTNGTPTTVQRSDSTITNISVTSNVATATVPNHNLYVGAFITISGATVDTDLNDTYVLLTTPSANSYTFATANVADATYTDATLVISTRYPLLNAAVWAIHAIKFTGGFTVFDGWVKGATNPGNLKCSDRTKY